MIKKLQALRAKKGFTLVELIVVIAIIGVLAAILVPTMMGFVTSSRVTSANSTAASFESQIENFLTEADTAGYGMKLSDTSVSVISIEIDVAGGTGWTVSVTNDSTSFKSTGTTSWTATSSVTTADTKVSKSADATALLGLSLQALFPDLTTGYVEAYVQAGNVEYVFYTADDNVVTDITEMQMTYDANGNLPATGNVNLETKVCLWDDNTAGISVNGLIVGTSPALGLGTP